MKPYKDKIILRAVEPEDVDFMVACEADRDNLIWSDYRAPLSRTQLLSYAVSYDADPIRSCQLRLIVQTEDGVNVGILDLYDISEKDSKAFIGICIHPKFRNSGYGVATLRELFDFNRSQLGLNQLLAKVSTKNKAGNALFVKSGFNCIATLPQWHRVGLSFHDFNLFQFFFINFA